MGLWRMQWMAGPVYGRVIWMGDDGAVEVMEGRKKVSWVELTCLMWPEFCFSCSQNRHGAL